MKQKQPPAPGPQADARRAKMQKVTQAAAEKLKAEARESERQAERKKDEAAREASPDAGRDPAEGATSGLAGETQEGMPMSSKHGRGPA